MDFLLTFLARVDSPPPNAEVFSFDELQEWEPRVLDAFRDQGILVPGQPALTLECNACMEGHWEEPETIEEPPGSTPRHYIVCREYGRVAVNLERLQRWRFDFAGFGAAIANRLGPVGRVKEIVADRLVFLGVARVAGGSLRVFVVRGLAWPDGSSVMTEVGRASAGPALALSVCNFPYAREVDVSILSLADISHLSEGHLFVELPDVLPSRSFT